MEKQSGVRGTLVVSLLTLCCSTVCSAMGIYAVADQGRTVQISSTAAVPMIFLGLLVWVVPPLVWSFIREDSEEA